jgi:hypothetical protein
MKRPAEFLLLRWMIGGVLLLVIIEGALRKWFLPQLSEFIYFAKDGLMLLTLGVYLISRKNFERVPARSGLHQFVLLAFCGIAFSAIGSSESPLLSIFGASAYLIFVPLIFLVPHAFQTTQEFERFMWLYLFLAIPLGVLGTVQFASPPDALINRYAWSEEDYVSVFGDEGSHARITGTFAYISGYTAYLQIVGTLLLPLVAGARTTVSFWIPVCSFVLVVGNIAMSGSRAPAYILAAVIAVYALAALQNSDETARLRRALLIGSVVVALAVPFYFSDAVQAFKNRMETSDEELVDRVFQHHDIFLKVPTFAGVLGFGPGFTHPGTAGLRRYLGLGDPPPESMLFEAEYVRIMVEIGWLGWLVWYAFRLYVIWLLLRVFLTLKMPRLRLWALAAVLTHLVSLTGGVVLNHVFSVYAWFLAGFALLLPKLDALETEADATVSAPEPRPRHVLAKPPPDSRG